MGTRGLFGFYYKNKYYVVYNHWDSYPNGLGAIIVQQIKQAIENGSFEKWPELIDQLLVVDETVPPTPDDINKLKNYTCLTVSRQSTSDWYCLLRGCQGSLYDVLNCGYIMNHVDGDGLPNFEQYAYIVNFDTNQFDFYVGCKKSISYDFNQLPDWE